MNAILCSLYRMRGVPDAVTFCYERQAIIAEFRNGIPYVYPFNL